MQSIHVKSCQSWAEELPCSSLFLPFFLSPQSRNTTLGPHACDFWHPVPQNTGSQNRMMASNSCLQAEKKRLPEETSICKGGLADTTIFGYTLTCTVKQINCLIQEKLLTGKNLQFGDPEACLHTVDVLMHLWITFVFAAFYEDEKIQLPLVKIKRPVCKYCCSAFLPRRALHMSGGGSVIREIPQGALSRGRRAEVALRSSEQR